MQMGQNGLGDFRKLIINLAKNKTLNTILILITMYSETLERLIQSVIADGVISEKERNVLHKKAEAEGVDIDEIDVYIDGLIAQQLNTAPKPIDPEVPEGPAKRGIITKCPNCGAVVEAGAVKCEDCGYVFRGVEANFSTQKLAEVLANIDEAYRNKSSLFDPSLRLRCLNEKATAVQSLPVPTTKEDLLEFIINMKSRFENQNVGPGDPLKAAYKSKYQECFAKAKLMFANDPQFQPIFTEPLKDPLISPSCLIIIICLLLPILLLFLLLLFI